MFILNVIFEQCFFHTFGQTSNGTVSEAYSLGVSLMSHKSLSVVEYLKMNNLTISLAD